MLSKELDEKRYRLVLVRHGESVGNALGFYQGQADFELNERGRAQAQALAQRWKCEGVTFDVAISSPLMRARQTAEIISNALDLELEFNPLWMERNNGQLAGLDRKEAAERFPRPAFIHPYMPIGGTGESQWDLYLRAGQAVRDIMARPPGRYLVVSHGGLLQMIMYSILGLTPQADFLGPQFRFRNTAFATLIYSPSSHHWTLEGINDRSHWTDSNPPGTC
jgi:2,3-bisphosphoglycerate-dependent phosphoglycerate mutase